MFTIPGWSREIGSNFRMPSNSRSKLRSSSKSSRHSTFTARSAPVTPRASQTSPYAPPPIFRKTSWSGIIGSGRGLFIDFLFQAREFLLQDGSHAVLGEVNLSHAHIQVILHFLC